MYWRNSIRQSLYAWSKYRLTKPPGCTALSNDEWRLLFKFFHLYVQQQICNKAVMRRKKIVCFLLQSGEKSRERGKCFFYLFPSHRKSFATLPTLWTPSASRNVITLPCADPSAVLPLKYDLNVYRAVSYRLFVVFVVACIITGLLPLGQSIHLTLGHRWCLRVAT